MHVRLHTWRVADELPAESVLHCLTTGDQTTVRPPIDLHHTDWILVRRGTHVSRMPYSTLTLRQSTSAISTYVAER